MSIQPVVPNLLDATRAFENKYTTGNMANPSAVVTALNALPQPRALRPATISNTISPLALYDQARANRGLSPLTARQTAAALKTLQSGRPATEPRRQSLYRSGVNDLRSLVGGIFHLPQNIAKEVTQLDELPGLIPGALNADNPIQALGNLANLPGLRMVPGSYIAGRFGEGGGGVQELLAHPLFTALDALPVANAAAKTTNVARTAKAAYAGQINALVKEQMAFGLDASTTITPRAPRALQTALTRTVDQTGAVVPNRLGRGLAAVAEDIRGTNFGSALTATFKERVTPRVFGQADQFIREAGHRDINTEALRPNVPGGRDAMLLELGAREASVQIQRKIADSGRPTGTPEALEFYERATLSRLPDGTPMPPEQMMDLSPMDRALAREIRDFEHLNAAYTDALPGPDSTRTLNIDGTPEVFDKRTADLIAKRQTVERSAVEVFEARQAALDPRSSPLPIPEIQNRLAALEARQVAGELTAPAAKVLRDLYTTAIESASRPDIARIIPALRAVVGESPHIPRLIDHLQKGRWSDANTELRGLSPTQLGRLIPHDLADIQAEVSRLIERDKVLGRTSEVNERYVARATRKREQTEARHHPARFDPILEADTRARTTGRVREVFATAPDLDNLIRLADERIFDTIITRDPRFQRWVREDQAAVNQGWKALRDAGHDPIFAARVTPEQAARQAYPRVTDKAASLQSVKKRMMDSTPYMRDFTVIVNQQGLDILSRRATQGALDTIGHHLGRTRASLVEEYTPRLLARAESNVPMRTRLAQQIKRGWEPFNPGDFGGKPTATFAVEGPETIYIPRAAAENMRRMFTPPLPRLTALFDKPMNAFRTSVLPLALRWQLNNGVGGMVVSAVEDPRALLELPGVLQDMISERKGGLPAADARMTSVGMPPPGIGSMDPEIMLRRADITPTSPIKERVAAVAQYASGGKLKDIYTTARESRISKITDKAKQLVERSYGANQFVDDMFRASMGRAKMKKYLKAGYSDEAAQALAASSIRRVFQAWDEMTPMERSVMRSVVPFYGFAAYSTRFVLHYPFDHPLRVSVLTSLADAEMQDALTGLPDYIREMILLGDPRANGVVRALNVAPFNPFGGVPSMFTTAGFLGQLNPIITGVLESVGLDVQQGGPQLHPELRYDPETGRLVADTSGNLASNIAGNLIPQVSGISSLLGWNDEFNETLARDPAAAGRMLLGNFGVPILYRDVNVGEQLIRTELARLEDQDNARKEALTTGDLSILDDFPGLKAYAAQVQALQDAGQLDQLRPVTGAPGASSGAGKAYALQAALLGQ